MLKNLADAKGMGIRLLMYGASGAGKSVRAADAVRWGRVEFHDFDGLAGNLRTYLEKNNSEALKRITFEDYKDEAGNLLTPGEIIGSFFSRIEAIGRAAESGKPLTETLVIDSYSRFEDLYVTHLLSLYKSSGTGFGSPRATIRPSEGTEVIIPGTADHDLKNRALYKFFHSLKTMKTNVIVNCHEYDDIKNEQLTIKASGSVRASMPTEFNEWHYLMTDTYGKHRVQVTPANGRLARTALSGLPGNGILLDNSLSVLSDRAIINPEFALVQSAGKAK